MRLFILTFLLLPFTGLCQDLAKVRSNSVKYLLKRLNNPDSYKSISWGRLEKVNTEIDYSPEGDKLDKQIQEFTYVYNRLHDLKMNKEIATKNQDDLLKDTIYLKAIKLYNQDAKILDSLKIERKEAKIYHKSVFDHYYIEHTFRARNGYNALMLDTYVFFLNKNLQVTSMDTESLEKTG